MIVVSDSSPLIALAAAGHLDLLRVLFGRVIVPEAVAVEALAEGRPGASALMLAAWVERVSVRDRALVDVLALDLDRGEAEAIAVAVEQQADLLLLDERRGRQRAGDLGLRYTGTVGLLLEAKRQGALLTVQPALDALRQGGLLAWRGGVPTRPRARRGGVGYGARLLGLADGWL